MAIGGESATLRRARRADAPALTQIALRSKASWGYDDDFMAACREELTVRAADLERGDRLCVLAEVDGRIAAYYLIDRSDSQRPELDALFVDPPYMRRGIGALLLDDALQRLRGASCLVVQSDPYAEAFYLREGGRRCGSRASGSIPGRMLPLFEFDLTHTDRQAQ